MPGVCCLHPTCNRMFGSQYGLTQHWEAFPHHKQHGRPKNNTKGKCTVGFSAPLYEEEDGIDFNPCFDDDDNNDTSIIVELPADFPDLPAMLENPRTHQNFLTNTGLQPANENEDDDESIASLVSRLKSCDDDSSEGSELSEVQITEEEQAAYQQPGKQFFAHTLGQKMDHELLTLLDSMNCPDDAFQKIMEWAQKSSQLGYNFNPTHKTRKALVQSYYKNFRLQCLEPKTANVKIRTKSQLLPNNIQITVFDFVQQLLSLLSDPDLMKPENLLINLDDFRKPFISHGNIGELLSAYWYKATCLKLRKSDREWVIPIILYTDKTHIDSKGRFKLDPVVFSLGIFKEHVRNSPNAWRPLGFKEILHLSSAEAATEAAGNSCNADHNYHVMMAKVLESYIKAQTPSTPEVPNPLCNAEIKIGQQIHKCDILVPLAYIVVDGEEADRVCNRIMNRTTDAAHITPRCDCPASHADNPAVVCKPHHMGKMREITLKNFSYAELQPISQKPVHNAFWKVNFGANPGGVHTACTPDAMHAVEAGTIERAAQVIFDELLTDRQKTMIDNLTKKYARTHLRQTTARFFPRSAFVNGLTNLSCTTCAEKVGILFVVVCLCSISSVREMLQEEVWPNGLFVDVLETMELLLCCHAFLKKSTFWRCPRLPQILPEETEPFFPQGTTPQDANLSIKYLPPIPKGEKQMQDSMRILID